MAPKVIAGNWKMNHGPIEARAFFGGLRAALETVPLDSSNALLVIFPPAISFPAARDASSGLPVRLGVQNVHWDEHGALTGEISAEMAAGAGADLVLVGHSERRHVFGETDEETAKKVGAAWRAKLRPVLCVGETLEEREADRTEAVVLRQLDAVLDAFPDEVAGRAPLSIAYEPVWAIGTGRTASPGDASNVHEVIRRRLGSRGIPAAASVPILYGGSVKPENARELLHAPEVDGVLVGGASLSPDSFLRIAEAAG